MRPVIFLVFCFLTEDEIALLRKELSNAIPAKSDHTQAASTFASHGTDAESNSISALNYPTIEDLVADPSLSVWSRWF